MRVIRKQLVKRAIDMISELADKGEEEYEKFWSQFGRNVKLGIVDDSENKTKLAGLLRVRCSAVQYRTYSCALAQAPAPSRSPMREASQTSWPPRYLPEAA